jgi:hypothetical protein
MPRCGSPLNSTAKAQETLRMSVDATDFGSFPPSVAQSEAQTMAEALADAYLEGTEGSTDIARLEPCRFLPAARLPASRGCVSFYSSAYL